MISSENEASDDVSDARESDLDIPIDAESLPEDAEDPERDVVSPVSSLASGARIMAAAAAAAADAEPTTPVGAHESRALTAWMASSLLRIAARSEKGRAFVLSFSPSPAFARARAFLAARMTRAERGSVLTRL